MKLDDTVLRERAAQENFPVASRALPRAVRSHLLAIYGFARVVDDTGDELAGDRMGALDALEEQLERAYRGTATDPAFVRLTPTLRELDLDDAPFRALIEANRVDQVVMHYDTWASLRGYCSLSANPVGRLVLAVFGVATPERLAWSDDVCTALQLVEHLQDVGEDYARGRALPPGRGPRPVRRVGRRSRCRDGVALAPRGRRARGRPRPSVAPPRGATALPQSPRSGAGGGRRIRRRWARGPRRDRARPLRRARRRRPSLARGHGVPDGAGRCRRSGRGMRRDDVYARCEQITRTEAKNFAFGIRLLPAPKRSAMSAIYAFARRIDDISDGDGTPDEKLAGLAAVRSDVDALRHGHARDDDPVLVALADTGTRYPVPWDAFDELVEGCERDATGAAYPTFPELVAYCRLVAGSVGRLSLAVFGTTDPGRAPDLADALGVALQLTNILRDVVEDREMGRIYLPADDFARFGADPDLTGPADAVAALVAFEADRARQWFDEGLHLLPLLDRRSRACVGAMAGIYRRLLTRITARPGAVLEGRMSLPTWEKVWIAGRSIAGLAPSSPVVATRVGV